ncbi:MAG TPA: inositol monophosphatase family protein [Bacteroidia bacterium]|nr:inositol monophosphatase family protein [Bacteroidia bacterium]
MPADLESVCRGAIEIIRPVGEFILSERRHFNNGAVELKGFNDLVSYVDKSSEVKLVQGLSALLPGSGFITEEKTAGNSGEEYVWVIDPLDGTTNYVHGIPCYCISVALLYRSVPVVGIVYELNLNELFYAWEGSPAFLNGKIIAVSKRQSASESLVATGFPYTDFSKMKEYMMVFDWCMKNTHGLRRLGSAAADLVYVACGRFEAFYEYGLSPWDVAAGALIVAQAGGRVTDFSDGNNFLFGKEIVASNTTVHNELLAVIAEKFSTGAV